MPSVKNDFKGLAGNKWIILTAALLAFYSLAGFFLAPWLIKRHLPALAERYQLQTTVEEVDINPFLFSGELRKFALYERGGTPVLKMDRVFVDFALSSLIQRALILAEIRLENPEIILVIITSP